ncbi:MAG: DNA-3-methyladenine glycosylase [bacterium]
MNVHEHLAQDPVMAGLIVRFGKLRLTANRSEPYAALSEAVIYQQLSGKAASTIFRRFMEQLGGGALPEPQQVLDASDAALRAAGLSRNKAASLRDIARHALDGRLPTLAACATLSDDELIERLTDIRGIGRWTVEMFLMFNLGRPDVLPVGDLGVRKGYQSAYATREQPAPKALAAIGQRWSPCRTLAAFYLWRAADTALPDA